MIPIRRLLQGYRRFSLIIAVLVASFVLYSTLTLEPHETKIDVIKDDRTTYVCLHNKCVAKITLEFKNESLRTFQSIESCRLICGEFGNLWPLPTSYFKLGKQLLPIDPTNMELTVQGSETVQSFMHDAFRIFRHNLITECMGKYIASFKTIKFEVQVKNDNIELNSKTDESYDMTISHRFNQHKITILAKTVYGARHGLETAAQLTSREFYSNICKVVMLDYANIQDSPHFRHRGILIDTSRQFIPVEDLERTISAMSANKLNVLHWHATDAHSFPLQLSNMPYLAEYGAYSSEEVYTDETITYLVQYAKYRGVRILMEIDTPAHTGNGWQFGNEHGMGDLVLCYNQIPWKLSCIRPPCGQLNPANNYTYEVLADIYKSIQELTENDEMFHMGGDEVYFHCWDRSEAVTNHMLNKGYPKEERGFVELWAEFQSRALKAWDKAIGHSKTKFILWSSALTFPYSIEKYLSKERYIIEISRNALDDIPKDLITMGYEVIFASDDSWFLHHGINDNNVYNDWKKVYDNIISHHDNVLGGEAVLRMEYADKNSMDTRLWPRASALAERLWSFPSSDAMDAIYRLAEMRERLVRRGVAADQLMPQWCYLNEGMC